MTTDTTTPARAPSVHPPHAAHPAIKYRRVTQLVDVFAGWRDRPRGQYRRHLAQTLTDTARIPADTAWLDRLQQEYLSALESARVDHAAIAGALATQRAAAQVALANAQSQLADALEAHATVLDTGPGDASAASVGETFQSPEEIASARARAHATRVAATNSRIHALTAAIDDHQNAIARLSSELEQRWISLVIEAAAITAYYNRRGATYTRKLDVRRRRIIHTPPTNTTPAWSTQPNPWNTTTR